MTWLEVAKEIESSNYFPNESNEDSHVDVTGNHGKYQSDMWDVAVWIDTGKSGSAQVVIYDDWLFVPDDDFDRVVVQFEVDPLTLTKQNSDGSVHWTTRVQVFKKVGSSWEFQTESSAWTETANHNESYVPKEQGVDHDFSSAEEYKIRLRVTMACDQSSGGTVSGECDFEVPKQGDYLLRYRYA